MIERDRWSGGRGRQALRGDSRRDQKPLEVVGRGGIFLILPWNDGCNCSGRQYAPVLFCAVASFISDRDWRGNGNGEGREGVSLGGGHMLHGCPFSGGLSPTGVRSPNNIIPVSRFPPEDLRMCGREQEPPPLSIPPLPHPPPPLPGRRLFDRALGKCGVITANKHAPTVSDAALLVSLEPPPPPSPSFSTAKAWFGGRARWE